MLPRMKMYISPFFNLPSLFFPPRSATPHACTGSSVLDTLVFMAVLIKSSIIIANVAGVSFDLQHIQRTVAGLRGNKQSPAPLRCSENLTVQSLSMSRVPESQAVRGGKPNNKLLASLYHLQELKLLHKVTFYVAATKARIVKALDFHRRQCHNATSTYSSSCGWGAHLPLRSFLSTSVT